MDGKEITGYVGGIQRFSTSDGPGIRSTVFLKGCPLNCVWCHNPELIGFGPELIRSESRCIGCGACMRVCPEHAIQINQNTFFIDRGICSRCMKCTEVCYAKALRPVAERKTVSEVLKEVSKDRTFYEQSGGGVTISGGELLSQAEFAMALLNACKESGYTVALDTSGYGEETSFLELAKRCDYILFDVKAGTEETHKRLIGKGLARIRKNLCRLAFEPSTAKKILLRMPLVNGLNDTEEEIDASCAFLKGLGLKEATLLPYHELGISKSRGLGLSAQRFSPPSSKRLHEIQKKLSEIGIHAEISGEE